MYLTRIPKHQKDFLSPYFSKREEPEGFCIKTYKGYLAGTHDIRLTDYIGDDDFEAECYLAITASKQSKEQFRKIINHTWIVKCLCEEEEYFELLSNINTIIKIFEKVIARCNEEYLDREVESLLVETGIITPQNIF
jgi:hypothetical protein